MPELRGVPPGRAGRLWLQSRLTAGRGAADLLDRRLRMLRSAHERFRVLEERAGHQWRAAWRRADEWAQRAVFLAGIREFHECVPDQPAQVVITWDSMMGVRYPAEAVCRLPEASTSDRGPGSAALARATSAMAEAIQAAAHHAAAAAARATIEADIAANRRRLRAITHRWLPRVEAALASVRRGTEEAERAETFRLRWASAHHNDRAGSIVDGLVAHRTQQESSESAVASGADDQEIRLPGRLE
jgi:V/A-type H+-transporting ATPase subunit D